MSFEIENGILKRYIPEQNITEVIIPDNIKVIGPFSFMNNPVIRRVIIPKTVKFIEKRHFLIVSVLKKLQFRVMLYV